MQNGRINSPKLRPRLSSSEKPKSKNMSTCLGIEVSIKIKYGHEGIMIILIITLLQELALVTHPGNTRKHVLLFEIPVTQHLCPHLSCNTFYGKCYNVVTHIPHALNVLQCCNTLFMPVERVLQDCNAYMICNVVLQVCNT